MYIILGYRWTAGSKNDFSTALFQIVPKTVLWNIKTQSKLPIDSPWFYQTDEKRACFTCNDAMVRISWVLEHNFVLFIPCLELCSCCLMVNHPPPHCYNLWKVPHESYHMNRMVKMTGGQKLTLQGRCRSRHWDFFLWPWCGVLSVQHWISIWWTAIEEIWKKC